MLVLVVMVFLFNMYLVFYFVFWGGLIVLLVVLFVGSLLVCELDEFLLM